MSSPDTAVTDDAALRTLADYYSAFSTLEVQAVSPYFHEPSLLISRQKPANLSLGSSAERSPQGPMDRPHFFFLFELSYQREPAEGPSGRLPRLVVRFSQKPLAVPAFTVQNGRAWS